MSNESVNIHEVLGRRLSEDPDFRASFLRDPRAALDSLVGEPVPSYVTVTATESDGTIAVTFGRDLDADLSESELASVAGGTNLPSIDYGAGVIYYDNNRNGRYDGGDSLIRHV